MKMQDNPTFPIRKMAMLRSMDIGKFYSSNTYGYMLRYYIDSVVTR
jgi:hypothetical protein